MHTPIKKNIPTLNLFIFASDAAAVEHKKVYSTKKDAPVKIKIFKVILVQFNNVIYRLVQITFR